MKKFVVSVLVALCLAGLAFGAYCWWAYQSAGAEQVPQASVVVDGVELPRAGYFWTARVLSVPFAGSLNYKEIVQAPPSEAPDLGVFDHEDILVQLPDGYVHEIEIRAPGETYKWADVEGTALPENVFTENGRYEVRIHSRVANNGGSYGTLYFHFDLELSLPPPPPPEAYVETSRDVLHQGEILVVRLAYLPEGLTPQAQTELGSVLFTPLAAGEDGQEEEWASPVAHWQALVPIGNLREPGEYTVQITAGENYSWQITVTVENYDFPFQNLEVDTTSSAISEASSSAAIQEFNESIPPLYETADPVQYWEGVFQWPAIGRITTEFGTERITNGVQSTWRAHYGMDIAAPEGTSPADYVGAPVTAPNNGRVVFAEYLLRTGYTIVIEHGGGLKSYYYHMNEINVEAGDMVYTGDLLGGVGSTGYSTGPHLHYEIRIGNQAIDPMLLFGEEASLYH